MSKESFPDLKQMPMERIVFDEMHVPDEIITLEPIQ